MLRKVSFLCLGIAWYYWYACLQVLEALLWKTPHSNSAIRPRLSRTLQSVADVAVSAVLRNCALRVTGTTLQYTQSGEPGPAAVNLQPRCRDALVVTIRSITLDPVVSLVPRK